MTSPSQIDFGFQPHETQHHFILYLPRSKQEDVAVVERFKWKPADKDNLEISKQEDSNVKVKISREKWDLVQTFIERTFNAQLRTDKLNQSKIKSGNIVFERLLGKELVMLLWGIEDAEARLIPTAIQTWSNFDREERWWLFTITNATCGHYPKKLGWRIALRYALTDSNTAPDKTIHNTLF